MSKKIRRVVTVILAVWGLVDAVLSFRDMSTFHDGAISFGISFMDSFTFIMLVNGLWIGGDWLVARVKKAREHRHITRPFPNLTPEQKERALEAVKRSLGDKAE